MGGKGGVRVAAALLAAVGLTGCGNAQDDEVERVAADFYTAVADRDGRTACRLLAPRTVDELEQSAGEPCEQAVLEEDIPTLVDHLETSVFGTMARMRSGADTAFLTRFPEGWRVSAVSCKPRDPLPYDCQVEGG